MVSSNQTDDLNFMTSQIRNKSVPLRSPIAHHSQIPQSMAETQNGHDHGIFAGIAQATKHRPVDFTGR
jgi:hypothetical protein